jgi:5-methylthioribose kinase
MIWHGAVDCALIGFFTTRIFTLMTYTALNDAAVLDYVRQHPALRAHFGDLTRLTAREVGDGNLNQVFIIVQDDAPTRGIVIKQALPYLRVVGESWALTRERMRYETQALRLYNETVPGLAPQVYADDAALSLVAMEYLGSHQVMRRPLVARVRLPHFADHISTFLATVLFKTSDLYLTGAQKKALQAQYINPEMNKIQEDFCFSNPFMESPENQHNPLIAPEVEAVRRDVPLKWAIADLKALYMMGGQALTHSDLHTGSLMVNADDTRVIDPEFSYMGMMGYDIGALLSNLMMNHAAHEAHTPDTAARREYQAYLRAMMRAVWEGFAARFEALWLNEGRGELLPAAYWAFEGGAAAFAAYRARYLLALLRDTAGLGACEALRRMMGIVSVWDIASIEDLEARARAERIIIRVCRRWILERAAFQHIDDLIGIMIEETPGS